LSFDREKLDASGSIIFASLGICDKDIGFSEELFFHFKKISFKNNNLFIYF
jgi:hypothetical protein